MEVFSAHGSNPTANWKISGAVQRVYDKSVKGYVFQCEGGPSAKMQLPKDERRLLGLVQPYLVLQLTVPSQKPFALELSISDTSKARRRVLLSTSFREPVRTPLHTRLPLASLHREVWLNLTFDLVDLVAKCFPAATFWRLEGVTIHAACKVRRVFTLKTPPLEGSSGLLAEPFTSAPATPADGHGGDGSDGAGSLRASGIGSFRGGYDDGSCSPPPLPSPLPRGYELPPGTVSITQVYSTSHALGRRRRRASEQRLSPRGGWCGRTRGRRTRWRRRRRRLRQQLGWRRRRRWRRRRGPRRRRARVRRMRRMRRRRRLICLCLTGGLRHAAPASVVPGLRIRPALAVSCLHRRRQRECERVVQRAGGGRRRLAATRAWLAPAAACPVSFCRLRCATCAAAE